jgi:GNAT superfamily N-acetyltransferase
MLDPRNVTFVAVPSSGPDAGRVVGYAQCVRLGDDEGAKAVLKANGRVWNVLLKLFGVLFTAWCKIVSLVVGGDKSADEDAVHRFFTLADQQDAMYYDSEKYPERKNRWHAQSVVVSKEYQGKGLGKRLMGELIGRAEKEGVPIGLESSKEGEMMYRSVGFELMARFHDGFGLEDEGYGGMMLYSPKAWRKDESVKI